MKRNWQTPALLGAIAFGIMVPRLSVLSFAVRYLMMTMLFLAFLKLRLADIRFHRTQGLLLLASPATGAAAYLLLKPFGTDLALAGFLIALTPTGTASPVVTGLIGGDPAYPALMVLASSILQPIIISAALPFLGDGRGVHGVVDLIVPLLSTIIIPFAAAALVRNALPSLKDRLMKCARFSFILWVIALAVVCGVASDFIGNSGASAGRIAGIGAASFLLCAFNFAIGRMIGGRKHGIEASQSLGQKNTVFTIWVALNFVNPLVALGPAIYILWHNIWNARQLHKRAAARREGDGSVSRP